MEGQAFSVSFSVGGHDAAWEEDWRGEAVRLLRVAADLLECRQLNPGDRRCLRDTNGNTIGQVSVNR